MKFTTFLNLKSYKGYEITFEDLIKKIKTESSHVLDARIAGKPSAKYDEIKETKIEVFQPNVTNYLQSRLTKYNSKSTGFVYVDIDDFSSKEEAISFSGLAISKFPFIAACWLSLSDRGLSMLVKVDKSNRGLFPGYWDKLNELFGNRIDHRTRSYDRLCCISFDCNVYVNPNAVAFDTLYHIDYQGLKLKEYFPDSEFINVNTPVIYPDGKRIIEINLHRYRTFKRKDGSFSNSNKIPMGKRNSTIGAIAMQLIYLNPEADRSQLLTGILAINRYYCSVPLSLNEVVRIFNANYKKLARLSREEFSILLEKYRVKKIVFFHRLCTLPKNEKLSIIMTEINRLKGKGKEYTEQIINDTIEILQDGITAITRKRIMELTSLSESTIKRYWKPFKNLINEYNSNLEKNKQEGSDVVYTLRGSNISSAEPPLINETCSVPSTDNAKEITLVDPFECQYDLDQDFMDRMRIDSIMNMLQSKRIYISPDTIMSNSTLESSTVLKHWPEFSKIAEYHNSSCKIYKETKQCVEMKT